MASVPTSARARNEHLTFRANDTGRHGWLRLTPAYSHALVAGALERCGLESPVVLDPFSGSGTTGVVAAEHGHHAHLVDVNPFLVWLARAKTRAYHRDTVAAARAAAERMGREGPGTDPSGLWQPALHRIERWWAPTELDALRVLRHLIDEAELEEDARDLLLVALCGTLITVSNAAFDHQSMSFATGGDDVAPTGPAAAWAAWMRATDTVLESAARALPGSTEVHLGDARALPETLRGRIDLLYTSPPYANRMSYVRELRPYMYWLRYLSEPRDAGELDWTAIGGTWGVATSRVGSWEPSADQNPGASAPTAAEGGGAEAPSSGAPGHGLPLDGELTRTCDAIRASGGRNADLLARYVHKYADDMWRHFRSAAEVVRPGGRAVYVVGNSTFFGEVVPVQDWYATMLAEAGFADVEVTAIRKRNSNKALYEYVVEARRP